MATDALRRPALSQRQRTCFNEARHPDGDFRISVDNHRGNTQRRRPIPDQPTSTAAGAARCRTAARHTHAWNMRPSSSHRTHTASGVDDTATASTRNWVPSFAGTHARTGRRPLPSTGPPTASGESEYRASSGAVYRSRRRPPTPRIVRTGTDSAAAPRGAPRPTAVHGRSSSADATGTAESPPVSSMPTGQVVDIQHVLARRARQTGRPRITCGDRRTK